MIAVLAVLMVMLTAALSSLALLAYRLSEDVARLDHRIRGLAAQAEAPETKPAVRAVMTRLRRF